MNKYYLIALLIVVTTKIKAQVPEGINFQSMIKDAVGEVVANQDVRIRISLLEGSTTGTPVYNEIHTIKTDNYGLLDLIIGQGHSPSCDFSSINWGKQPFFVQVEMDPEGGENYLLSSTTQLLSVPYALMAKSANIVDGAVPGDMFYYNGNNWEKIPIGTESQVLGIKNSKIAWLDFPYDLGTSGTFIDNRDGIGYKWVKIGEQIWMAENLRATAYSDGTPLTYVQDDTDWGTLQDNNTDKAYSYYNNNANGEKYTYGALYTYAAAVNGTPFIDAPIQGICPAGWHIPSDAEWTSLKAFLANNGHAGTEGTALKARTSWNNDGNGTDNYDFCALGSAYRRPSDGASLNLGNYCQWWSASEYSTTNALYRYLGATQHVITRYHNNKSCGFSVRCIKD